jgi:hypothetical protein
MNTLEKAKIWWNGLSINEQNEFISKHPYYSKFRSYYVLEHKNGILDLYNYTQFGR